jgi:DNA-binding response OmpR family regulator
LNLDPGARRDFCKIFIVEDDPDDRFITQEAFQDLKFPGKLKIFQDADELFSYLQSNLNKDGNLDLPELIILDLNMPEKDGFQTLRELKESVFFNNIPIIILSTSSQNEDLIKCLDLGAHKYITKPASYKNLVNTVESLIKKYCNGR